MSDTSRKSASSGQTVPLGRKLDEGLRQFWTLVKNRNPFRPRNFDRYDRDLDEYRAVAQDLGGFALDKARIFEIGCGQRPYRLFWLRAHGLDANAIDMDKVVFRMGPREFMDSWRRNGAERTLKTALRFYLFDLAENRHFRQALSTIQGTRFDWPLEAIALGDATDPANWPEDKIDFVYSEDVFEHIPPEVLPRLCARMAAGLSAQGIAVVRPMVYTGIQGGHNVEYYNLDPAISRTCPPWDHLRDHRYPSNTYLNRLTRADYRALFSEHFEIIDETVRDPERGRAFMTDALREELSDWSDEELFSNQLRFVLRPKQHSGS